MKKIKDKSSPTARKRVPWYKRKSWFQKKKTTTDTAQIQNIPHKSQPYDSPRKALLYRFILQFFYAVTFVIVILIIAYNVTRLHYTDIRIKEWLIQQAHEQTGGELIIDKMELNVLTGLSLTGISFYPTNPVKVNTTDEKPIFKVEKLQLQYSLKKLLTGRLHISSFKLIHPQIYLKKENNTFNFNPVILHRNKYFPSIAKNLEEKQKETVNPTEEELATLKSLVFFMPLEIMIHDIGVSNLDIRLLTYDDKNIISDLDISGISLDMGAYWYKKDSNIWISLHSSFEQPLGINLDRKKIPATYSPDNKGNGLADNNHPPKMETVFSAISANIIRLELINFSKLNLDVASLIPTLNLGTKLINNASLNSKGRITASEGLHKITIHEFSHQIIDALNYSTHGEISLENPLFQKFNVHLNKNLSVDLNRISEFLSLFLPKVSLSGILRLDQLLTNGEIDLKKIGSPDPTAGLPAFSGNIWFDNISASLPDFGIDLQKLSGKVSALSSPKVTRDGFQGDVSIDLVANKFKYAIPTEKSENTNINLSHMNFKLVSRLIWPEALLPILNIDFEAAKILVNSGVEKILDSSVFFDINAEGDKNLEDISVNSTFEVGKILELTLSSSCQKSCAKFRVNLISRLESLKSLHGITSPLKGSIIPNKFMPSALDGIADFQFNAKGEVPNPLQTPLFDILQKGEIKFNLQSNISKIDAKIPFMDLTIASLDNRIIANGDLKEQNIELAQKLKSISLTNSTKNQEKQKDNQKIDLENYTFDVQIKNSFLGPIDLDYKKINFSTQILTWFTLGKLYAPELISQPLTDISFETDIYQESLKQFSINNISVRSPDYGIATRFSSKTQLNDEFIPVNLNMSFYNQITHNGDENLPHGLKTTGRLDTKISIETENMSDFTLDGIIGFEKLSFSIKDASNPEKNQISFKEINGSIPLRQKITMPHIRNLILTEKNPTNPGEKNSALSENADLKSLDLQNIAIDKKMNETNTQQLTEKITNYFEKKQDKLRENTNNMALVDYGTLKQFFPNRTPVSIQEVDIANLELKDLEFDIELKQNWFALNQYLSTFLGGKIQGSFLLAFEPNLKDFSNISSDIIKIPKNIRTSMHLTRLDTRKLIDRFPNLKGKAESLIPPFSNPYLDGTLHLSYDLNTNEITGGIAITSIGKEQLKMILYYIDPFEQNRTISDIRKSLNIGEVRQVSIPIKNGEIDLDVDVRVLEIPIPTPKLTRFPISQLIGNFKDQSAEENSKNDKRTQKFH